MHGELFASTRPAATFVEVCSFIDPEWLIEVEVEVEIEIDAVMRSCGHAVITET